VFFWFNLDYFVLVLFGVVCFCCVGFSFFSTMPVTVHFLLRDLLRGIPYLSNFVAHPLTDRFVAVLTHFLFSKFYSQ